MALSRLTWIFALTTEAASRAVAQPRSGGWSESLWSQSDQATIDLDSAVLARNRASLLPKQASIIGQRQQTYTISGNKLLPGGSASGRVFYPGNAAYDCDIPQMNLDVSFYANGSPNSSLYKVRGIPDIMVTTGEYSPTAGFNNAVQAWAGFIVNKTTWGFVCRDKSQPTGRVMSIAGNVVTVDAAIPGVVVGTWLRFFRVKLDSGLPAKGAFQVTAVNGTAYTLAGYSGGNLTKPSGLIRIDMLKFVDIGSYFVSRITTRKVGNPSNRYRGRASKKRG